MIRRSDINSSAKQFTYTQKGLWSSVGPRLVSPQTQPRNRHGIPSNFTVIEPNYSSKHFYGMLYYYHANKSKFHLTPNNIYDYLLSSRPRRVFCTDIARTTTVTQRTAVPRSSFHYCLCVSADWVATAMFSFITPHRTSKDDWRKPQIDDFSTWLIFFVQTPFKF